MVFTLTRAVLATLRARWPRTSGMITTGQKRKQKEPVRSRNPGV